MALNYFFLGAASLLILSVVSSKFSEKLGVPSLLLFLVVGMLAGSEGPGGIYFDNALYAQYLGVAALAYILFSGGLDTPWEAARPVLGKGLALSTAGVILTAACVGAAAVYLLGFSWKEGFLLGAVVSSTDAAAVFSVLRSRSIGLKGNLRPLLEFESGSNDPMAVFLTTAVLGAFADGKMSLWDMAGSFVLQMGLGGVLGYLLGRGFIGAINRLALGYEGLYPVLTLAFVLLVYGGVSALGGNGFLAVYAAGLVLGNNRFIRKKSLLRFQDGVAWLMQIAMFLVLGLLVFPRQLVSVAGPGILLSFILIFAARPAGVFLSLAFSGMDWREKCFVSWVGLRGAAPIVLATFPLLAGIPKAHVLFNLVFFIVLTSVLIQGTTIPWVAKRLGVSSPLPPQRKYPLEFDDVEGTDVDLVDFLVPYGSNVAGKNIVALGLPKDSLIVLINRNGRFRLPSGDTVLEEGDVLLVLAGKEGLSQTRRVLTGKA